MLTTTGRGLAGGAAAFLAFGLLFGNWPVIGAGALLLILACSGGLARSPRVTRVVDSARLERGGTLRFTLHVETRPGLGVIEIHQELPEEFDLLSGNNLHLVTQGLRRKTRVYEFVARAPKRGEYVLPPVQVKLLHPMGLQTSGAIPMTEPLTITVEPRPIAAKLPRDLRTRAKRPFPDGDIARMGVATNEFRELREYVRGDPPRKINWKATARRISSGAGDIPLVNETEWEGKKTVWILVDGHPRLSVGTNINDARERAADAALSLTELYLRRGYQVGMAFARSGPIAPLRPGTGEAQVGRAREMLTRLACAEGPSFIETLRRDAVYLHRGKPLVVLVTRLSGPDSDLEAAIRRLSAIGITHGRRVVPGVIIDLEPPTPQGEEPARAAARAAMDAETLALRAAARAGGLRVARWRLEREPLEAVLTRGRLA